MSQQGCIKLLIQNQKEGSKEGNQKAGKEGEVNPKIYIIILKVQKDKILMVLFQTTTSRQYEEEN